MESKFNLGDLVIIVGRPDKKGVVTKVLSPDGGLYYYDVLFLADNHIGSYAEIQLSSAEIPDDPWNLFANNQHRGHEEFGLVTTFHKVRNTTNNTISTLRASRTEFKPYQYKPLIKFLNSINRRILVADEVGLGKTIEAGHIMLELAGRGEFKNSMIICPKSLINKWQIEMREKFNFEFKIINTRKELLNDYSHCKTTGEPFRSIITYDAIRSVTDNRRDLASERNLFLLELEKAGQFFDLIVCDEAHYVRNPNLRHHGLEKVIEASSACVFLTATPVMTGIDNLYYLLRLLDGEAYYREEQFHNAVQLNKPFIRALNQLNNRETLNSILVELQKAEVIQTQTIGDDFSIKQVQTVEEYFKNDPLYNRVVSRLKNEIVSPTLISAIQKDLTDLNSLNHIYTRTRKKEVYTDGRLTFRNPRSFFVKLTKEEMDAYTDIIEEYSDEPLALVQKKRLISSSIPAYFGTEAGLSKGIIEWPYKDSKFEYFRKIIDEIVLKNKRKLIVFSSFRKTLFYLKAKLEEQKINCLLFYGDTINRQDIIDQFRENNEIKIFLSSQVGTEGVDLQFCNAIVNYDLPWNPMVVEQRIGRIDRIGQKEDVIHIYSLVLGETVEEQIFRRLLDRIQVFKESIGDLESILAEEGSPIEQSIVALEKELYTNKLTHDQQQKKIDTIAIAIENQRRDLDLIKSELTDSMVNDIYFQNAIKNIIYNQQYITENELIFYLRWVIRDYLQATLLQRINENVYCLEVPLNNKSILTKFISENIDIESNRELRSAFHKFTNRFRTENKINLTFNSEYARLNPGIEFINSYHPFVLAITGYIEKQKLHINQIFQFSVEDSFLKNEEHTIEKGDYLMCVYKIIVEQGTGKQFKRNEYLHPVVMDTRDEENLSFLTVEEAQFFLGKVQEYAKGVNEFLLFNSEIVELIRPRFLTELNKIKEQYRHEEQIKIESYKQRALKQLEGYYKNLISIYQRQIDLREYDDKILPVFKQRLQEAIDKFEEKKENIIQTKVFIDNALVSISYIQVN